MFNTVLMGVSVVVLEGLENICFTYVFPSGLRTGTSKCLFGCSCRFLMLLSDSTMLIRCSFFV